MFTRQLTMKIKPNLAPELAPAMENSVIPMLRKQKGFRDQIIFVAPERSEAISYSLWDTKADAEAYNHVEYPNVLKALANVLDGNPRVATFEVTTSTFLKTAAKTA